MGGVRGRSRGWENHNKDISCIKKSAFQQKEKMKFMCDFNTLKKQKLRYCALV